MITLMATPILLNLILIGALLGLVACALGHALCGPASPAPPHGPTLSDADGALEELVIHHVAEAGPQVEIAYRDLLGQLPDEVKIRVVCPTAEDFADLQARLGPLATETRSLDGAFSQRPGLSALCDGRLVAVGANPAD